MSAQRKEKNESKNEAFHLEMNHSHYLMLDDGAYGRSYKGDFRTRLNHRIACHTNETELSSRFYNL
jgi:hypothetical protein